MRTGDDRFDTTGPQRPTGLSRGIPESGRWGPTIEGPEPASKEAASLERFIGVLPELWTNGPAQNSGYAA